MIRLFILLFALGILFGAGPATAETQLFVGGNASDSDSESKSASPVFVQKNSKSKSRALFNGTRKAANKTAYGNNNKSKKAAASGDRMAMLAEQNRQADYEIMMKQSEATQKRIARNQAARDARRAQEEDETEEGTAVNGNDVQPSVTTTKVKRVYAKPSGLTTPKKVFNSYR